MMMTRPVALVERFFLALETSSAPTRAECMVQQIIEGEGTIDEVALRQAVRLASLANPGSRMLLRGHWGWLRWQVTDQTTPVQVLDSVDWSGSELDPRHPDLLSPALDFRSGPASEVILVRKPVPRLLVRTHHALMDGRGMMTFVEDIFRCLRGEAPLGSDHSVQYDDLAEFSTERPLMATRANAALPGAASDRSNAFHLELRRFAGGGRAMLARLASAIASQTFVRHPQIDEVRFLMPADLRPLRPGLRSTVNLASALSVTVRCDDDVEHISAMIRAKVAAHEAARLVWRPHWQRGLLNWVPLSSIRLVLGIFRRLRRRGRVGFLYTASLSNLGPMPLASYCCDGFRASASFLPPPAMSTAAMMVTLCGNGDQQWLAAMSPGYALAPVQLATVMDQLAAELGSAGDD
ncbi:MAG: hypothetical protein ACK4SX_12075 [Alcanivoracaceae bacterium]